MNNQVIICDGHRSLNISSVDVSESFAIDFNGISIGL